MEIDIKQRLEELKAKERELTLQYAELLMLVMRERGLKELMLVPLDGEGDLMCEYEYSEECGEWGLNWNDLRCGRSSVITRFAIIDGELMIHTSKNDFDKPDDDDDFDYIPSDSFHKEKKKAPWIKALEVKDCTVIYRLIVKCLTEKFFWKFRSICQMGT